MRRNRLRGTALAVLIILGIILIACNTKEPITIKIGTNGGTNASSSAQSSTNNTTTQGITTGSSTQGIQLYVEPDDGESVITNAINDAHKSIWLEMYLLTDKKVISALESAAHRGLDVRVMIETHPYGSGSISPTETLDKLQAAGIQTASTNPQFALTHEKGMVIDGQTAYIMTSNFTQAALGASKYTLNREYGIIDSNSNDVQEVQNIFQADWNRQTPQLNNNNLVVSPVNARASLTDLINGAKKTLLIEAEEMQDSSLEQALTAAEKRGVQVQVILPQGKSQEGSNDNNASGINTIKNSGVQVKQDTKLYMHAKIIVADGSKAFVGSENISTASLEKNRELGIILTDSTVINKLQQTFQQDWNDSQTA
jgi:phosphatidylserine/phosphatidylglycerophosphate/cardiolipin synthase-like enzyme